MTTLEIALTITASVEALALLATASSGPRCPHDWQLVDKIEFKPKVEDVKANGYTFQRNPDGTGGIPHDYFVRKTYLAIRCTKCGALEMKKLES